MVFSVSLPVERAAVTNKASPKLASQAPSDNIITHDADTGNKFSVSINGTTKTRLKVIPSRASRDINK